MTTALLTSRMGTAMRNPVHAQQQTFRAVLTAMASPGRVIELPAACVDGIEGPQGTDGAIIGAGLTALLLTLLDRETSVRLHPPFDSEAVRQYLRFHTGVRSAEPAAYEVVAAAHLDRRLCMGLTLGTDEEPQRGATLIVDVPRFDAAQSPPLLLRGPGIEWTQCLPVGSLEPAVWRWRMERQADFPRGVDMLFVHGLRVAALPRSTRLQETR
jgi:alpha-D-ribose 1-methylphosphonate 5-triphosphate synthase subunit PhnH